MENLIINPFENQALTKENVMGEMVVSRQVQEVQASMVIAKKFPRDEIKAFERIKKACSRKSLANRAIYNYPRSGTLVTGASIRLAEILAQNWGNIDFGIIELERADGFSNIMSYAWDLETNTRQSKIFTVNHIRSTKKGNIPLTDERDIYELIANNGARRMRNCILGILPIDIVEAAIAQCEQTLLDETEKLPIEDLVRNMAVSFKRDLSIEITEIEKYIGYKTKNFTKEDLVKLQKIYNTIKEGAAKREDYFKFEDLTAENPFENKKIINGKEKNSKNEADSGQLLLPES